jgi:hypothetical protein
MGNCSTLIYVINNQHILSERILDFGVICNDIDADLDQVFGEIEFQVDPDVVKKTLALIKANN